MAKIDEALTLLSSADWEQRVAAVRMLKDSGDRRANEGLERALHDSENEAVIEAAAEAFLARFDSGAMAALSRGLQSSDFDGSQTVADVLFGAEQRGRFAADLLAAERESPA